MMEKKKNQRIYVKCSEDEKARYMQLSDNLAKLVRQLLDEELEIYSTLEDLIKNEPTK